MHAARPHSLARAAAADKTHCTRVRGGYRLHAPFGLQPTPRPARCTVPRKAPRCCSRGRRQPARGARHSCTQSSRLALPGPCMIDAAISGASRMRSNSYRYPGISVVQRCSEISRADRRDGLGGRARVVAQLSHGPRSSHPHPSHDVVGGDFAASSSAAADGRCARYCVGTPSLVTTAKQHVHPTHSSG